jgi:hypothetical protein
MKMADLLNLIKVHPMCNFSSVWRVGWKAPMFQVSAYTAVTIFRVKEAKGGCSTILRCTERVTHQTIHFHSPRRPLL